MLPTRRLIKALALLVILAAAGVFTLWRLTWASPAWYQPNPATDRAAADLAESVENRILEESHKLRPDVQPWTLRVRTEHVNAWLANRLNRWLIHEQDVQWPEQLGLPQVRLGTAGIDLAVELSSESQPRVIVLRVMPEIIDDRLYVRYERFSLGRLAMPGQTLEDLVDLAVKHGAGEALQQADAQWLLNLFAGDETLDPVATLADGRRVRLVELRLGAEYLDLTLQTLPPAAAED